MSVENIHLVKTATSIEREQEGRGRAGIGRGGRDRERRVMVPSDYRQDLSLPHPRQALWSTLKPRGINTLMHTPIHSYTHNLSFSLVDVQEKVTNILKGIFR